eukprot:348886-Pelagomonas_calceolata.AAC.2
MTFIGAGRMLGNGPRSSETGSLQKEKLPASLRALSSQTAPGGILEVNAAPGQWLALLRCFACACLVCGPQGGAVAPAGPP